MNARGRFVFAELRQQIPSRDPPHRHRNLLENAAKHWLTCRQFPPHREPLRSLPAECERHFAPLANHQRGQRFAIACACVRIEPISPRRCCGTEHRHAMYMM